MKIIHTFYSISKFFHNTDKFPIASLCPELIFEIFKQLDFKSLCSARISCKCFYNITQEDFFKINSVISKAFAFQKFFKLENIETFSNKNEIKNKNIKLSLIGSKFPTNYLCPLHGLKISLCSKNFSVNIWGKSNKFLKAIETPFGFSELGWKCSLGYRGRMLEAPLWFMSEKFISYDKGFLAIAWPMARKKTTFIEILDIRKLEKENKIILKQQTNRQGLFDIIKLSIEEKPYLVCANSRGKAHILS